MRLSIFCLIAIGGFLSCKKELDVNSYWQCNQSQNLDSAAVNNALFGTFIWEKQSCASGEKVKKADKVITVTFKSDQTFMVKESATILTSGSWNIMKVSGSWELNLSSPSSYLYGRILLCNHEVLFNNSYRDGCDNLFK